MQARPALLCLPILLSAHADVVINEVHYDSEPSLERAEFIELHNSGLDAVDLSGWHFEDGIQYEFPSGTVLQAGAFLVLAENLAGFDATFNPPSAQRELAHWRFDEASGTVAAESTGRLNANGQPLTALGSGGVSLGTPGVFGNAAAFNGVNGSHFTIPYLDGIHTNSYTFSAWANLADLGRNPVICDWSSPWAYMLISDTAGIPTFWHRMATNPGANLITFAGAAWATNQWRHVAVAFDRPAQVARFYVDGALVARQVVLQPAANLPMSNNNRNHHIGWKQDSGDTFNGRLDEVRVVQGALTAAGIQQLQQSNTLLRTQVLDLADMVGGGNGTLPGTGSASGIDAATGTSGLASVGGNFTPSPLNGYFPVTSPFIDGVFSPNGALGAQPVTSTGLAFDFTGTGNAEVSYGYWVNGVGPITDPSLSANLPAWSSDPNNHSLLAAHAQKGITFDLDAIEAANDGRQVRGFTCVAGDARGKAGGNIGILVLVDGVERFRQLNMVDTESAIDIAIAPGERFLTLVSVNSDGGNNSDHAYFGDPFLHIEAASVVPVTPLGQYAGNLSSDGEKLTLRDAANVIVDEVDYGNAFPWPVAPNGEGPSLELIHPGLDNDLGGSWRASAGAPTPGRTNRVYAVNAPPQMRQVEHSPTQPTALQPLTVRVKVTDPDGVASVSLSSQIVAPGAYIPAFLALSTPALLANPNQPRTPNPAFENPANWTTVPMTDDGLNGDALAGDGIFTATVPGQPNRTLVRYRITATDTLAASVRVPYTDDPSLNFAAFVYDGVPAFTAGTRSVTGTVPTVHPQSVMASLPAYILLTTTNDYSQCLAYTGADQIPANNFDAREAFNWNGTFVHEGRVYDHMRYRLRQRNDRYGGAGKRSFRFRFNKGNYAQFSDIDGNPFPTKWRSLNSHKMTALGGANWGLHEFANSTLWNLFGTPAPRAHWYGFRVIKGAEEAPAGTDGQHLGDFQGMWLGLEDYDARFFDSHNLPQGNLYKLTSYILNGKEVQRYQNQDSVGDATDFANILNNLRPARPNTWLEQHVDLPAYYRYQTVVDAVRHYDVQPNTGEHLKNRAWWFRPDPASPTWGKLHTLPWDSDASWGPNYNAGVAFTSFALYGDGTNPVAEPRDAFLVQFRNSVREFRDLVWREDQVNQLIDRLRGRLEPFSLADRDRWTGAPAAAGSQTDLALASRVQEMKNFAFVGGAWAGGDNTLMPVDSRDSGISGLQGRDAYLDSLHADADIPATPALTFTGTPGFPVNGLSFTSSAFGDPQGTNTFAALEWRVARYEAPPVLPLAPGTPVLPRFEYDASWLSGVITQAVYSVTIPVVEVRTNRLYRARVRHQDITGRWSHWSAPVEFTPAAPSIDPLLQNLVISELLYNPTPATAAEVSNGWETADFEFVELHNRSTDLTLDLTDVRFVNGIDLDLAPGLTLVAGEYAMVVRNLTAFQARHGSEPRVLGTFSPDKLDNAGERIRLDYGTGNVIRDFTYDELAPWPVVGSTGCSISLVHPETNPDPSLALNWHATLPTPGGPLAYDYACWSTQFTPPGQQGSTDDPDGDGIANLAEFAYGTHPNDVGSTHAPFGVLVSPLGNQHYAIRWQRSPSAVGLTTTVEISSNLVDWHFGPGHTEPVGVTANGDGTETITVRDASLPDAEPRRYFRLRFEVP